MRGRLLAALLAVACDSEAAPPARVDAPPVPPEGFPALPVPADNPITPAKIALGRKLFFEARLSRTMEISCASCHLQERGFADPRRVSLGVEQRPGTRNAPALANLAYGTSFFWDGGVTSLERQALAPIIDKNEMDLPIEAAAARLADDAAYRALFAGAFGAAPTPGGITYALATFVRTMVSGDSRFDRFQRGDPAALDAAEQRGMATFFGERGQCFHCHDGFNFTSDRFANNGTYLPGGDEGRRRVTGRPIDLGRFKIPTLRNVAATAPYMHDGSIATLEEVVEHYARGGRGHDSTDPNVHRLALDDADQRDLVAFLRSLTDQAFLRDPRFAP